MDCAAKKGGAPAIRVIDQCCLFHGLEILELNSRTLCEWILILQNISDHGSRLAIV
jgi:hypothetical protein